ncbi:hypothetical protein [Phytoactinopolyspora limicola]|uniref:hypothetical protein n=1 Tax=Phytoactinopolyspora limicola TaxID=2715536 RepID=UPI00140764AF|nr:hypothetical protein [Phytoactinopolyspora limicola]
MSVRFAAVTLFGVWAAPVHLVGFILDFSLTGMPYRGEGMWTVDWLSGVLWLVGPLAAALSAVDAARFTRPGRVHLVVTAAGHQRPLVWAAMWCAVPLMGVHLVAVGVVLVLGGVTRPSAGWGPMMLALAVGLLVIVWCVALGSAIGRFLGPIVAGLAAGVVCVVLFLVIGDEGSGFSGRFALLETGAGSAPRIGYGYNLDYLGGQALVLAVTAGVLLLLGVRERSGRVLPTVGGALLALGVVAVVPAASAVLPGDRYVVDASPPDHCSGSMPRICTYVEHDRVRADLVAKIEVLSEAALDAGYPALVPDAVHERSRTYWPDNFDTRGFQIPTEVLEGQEMQWFEVAYGLVDPVHCDALRADIGPPDEFWGDLTALIFTWLDLASLPTGDRWFDPDHDRLLSPGETTEVIDRFARCELER